MKEIISKILRQDAVNQDERKVLVGKIRAQQLAATNAAVEKYQNEWRDLELKSKQVLKTTIVPWWHEFSGEGTYRGIRRSIKENQIYGKFWLADSVEYFWPRHALRVLGKWTDKGVGFVNDNPEYYLGIYKTNPEYLGRDLTIFANEKWKATFFIDDCYSSGDIKIWREPQGGWGRFGNFGSNQYELSSIDLGNLRLYKRIHPVILLHFASQIESGRVWEKIKESLETAHRWRK